MLIERYLNVIEAARMLKIHPESVKRLIRQGDLPAIKVGNVWLIDKDKLEVFAGTYTPKRGRRRGLL